MTLNLKTICTFSGDEQYVRSCASTMHVANSSRESRSHEQSDELIELGLEEHDDPSHDLAISTAMQETTTLYTCRLFFKLFLVCFFARFFSKKAYVDCFLHAFFEKSVPVLQKHGHEHVGVAAAVVLQLDDAVHVVADDGIYDEAEEDDEQFEDGAGVAEEVVRPRDENLENGEQQHLCFFLPVVAPTLTSWWGFFMCVRVIEKNETRRRHVHRGGDSHSRRQPEVDERTRGPGGTAAGHGLPP
jgi:hypothetical protein